MTEKDRNKGQSQYGAGNITVLEGLDAVRKRPAMYIGSVNERGLHHLIWEIVDNSIDEYLAGYGKHITITIHRDDSITVEDEGRGIPVDINEQTGIPALELVLTTLHAGGKFGGEGSSYSKSGGLHGVGSSCVNALSDVMIARVKRDGKRYEMAFSKGVVTKKLHVVGTCPIEETGTSITFTPDPTIFTETTTYDYDTIFQRMRESAFLNAGLSITLVNEKDEDSETHQPKKEVLFYEKGIQAYIEHINKGKKVLHDDILYIKGEKDGVEVEVSLQYHEGDKEGVYSFANNIKTTLGGSHEAGFKSALTTSVKTYLQHHQLLKGKKEVPVGEDTRQGVTAIVSVKVPDPQFEGQTKGKLNNSDVRPIVDSIVGYELTKYFEENPSTAGVIMGKIIENMELRLFVKKQRELEKKNRKGSSSSFSKPEKLAPCKSRDKNKIELYLVEGDSAGGSAKKGRNRDYQAILPLRGKVINTERASLQKILANNEIQAIISTIGAEFGEEFDVEKAHYDKVVIMTDADVDGSHIELLLLTFFYRHMRPLVEKGHLYLAQPPLFKLSQGKKVYYAYSDRERDAVMETLAESPKPTIQRYKGLGEMNPEQLWETTMNPETRTLIQVTIDDAVTAELLLTELMGEEASARKAYIEKHAHEATIDL